MHAISWSLALAKLIMVFKCAHTDKIWEKPIGIHFLGKKMVRYWRQPESIMTLAIATNRLKTSVKYRHQISLQTIICGKMIGEYCTWIGVEKKITWKNGVFLPKTKRKCVVYTLRCTKPFLRTNCQSGSMWDANFA